MADPFPRRGRDLRLDFFRGLSLFFIFIDHIPNNFLGWFTLRSIAFSDAAEVFIFISGYTAALVYGRSMHQHGALFASAQIYRRVWQLYVAHIFLFVIFIAEVSYVGLAVNNPMYTEEARVGEFLQEPHIAVIKALVLEFQPAFLDILPLYIVLLGSFPLVLIALERGALWALLPSAALYALTLRHDWSLPSYPADSAWFFNPLAWQFTFVLGFALAREDAGVGALVRRHIRWLRILALPFLIYFTFGVLFDALWDPTNVPEPKLFFLLDKTWATPPRLIQFLSLVAVFSPLFYYIRRSAGLPYVHYPVDALIRMFALLGRNSLYVFCVGSLLSLTAQFVRFAYRGTVGVDTAVVISGIIVMAFTAWLAESRQRARPASPAAQRS